MQEISTTAALREQLSEWRHSGDHIALVPTMGNLHDGHLSLVSVARGHAERVVVSIFVNPTQFGEGEDFEDYPRSLERDKRRLKRLNTDLMFVPDIETMYPFGIDNATSVTVPVLSDQLCGSFRPGHFDGMTSVVSRLFSLVQPDVAVFGQKDYQQLLLIRRLTQDLSLPIEIICGPTQREEDGLAQSSRNQYLSDKERAIAPNLFAILNSIGQDLESGKRNYDELEEQAVAELHRLHFEPEYVTIRRAENLDAPDRDNDELVILAAVRLGKARLIDNILVHI
ncbi:MAG: pantoate--beta-alanine ligase [Gammaproteobacteria bacterium]|nr:MAG: pantoate--beta-alanine ligase [Gammaproteobacteria bacterium]